jgi:hypothetical protein
MDVILDGIMRFIGANQLLVLLLLLAWILPWKGWALWLAARRGEKGWFVLFLIVNTLAILEIIYIFAVAKRSEKKG